MGTKYVHKNAAEEGRHLLAGRIVHDEIGRQGKTQRWAAARAGMSVSTLNRVFNGDPKLTPIKLRSIEGALALADQLLTYVINGDITSIQAIPADELRPGQQRIILAALTQHIPPNHPSHSLGGSSHEELA